MSATTRGIQVTHLDRFDLPASSRLLVRLGRSAWCGRTIASAYDEQTTNVHQHMCTCRDIGFDG